MRPEIYQRIGKEVKEYVRKNSSAVIGHQVLTQEEYSHIEELATSVVLTRDEKLMGGSFVKAVVNNDLQEAINRADSTSLKAIKLLVLVKLWCHPIYE